MMIAFALLYVLCAVGGLALGAASGCAERAMAKLSNEVNEAEQITNRLTWRGSL